MSRKIGALESAPGATLFERSARGLTLTDTGRDHIDHVRDMGEAATLISMVAEGKSQEVTGEVTVTWTDLVSATILPRMLKPLRETAPDIRVRFLASHKIEDLAECTADIAIHHVKPDQPDRIARHLGGIPSSLYASSSYLDGAGCPQSLNEVADCNFIGKSDPEHHAPRLETLGLAVRPERFVILIANGVVAWEHVKAVYGATVLPKAIGDAKPTIETIPADCPSLSSLVWLANHRKLQTNRWIRIVFDTLAKDLGERLSRRDRITWRD